MAVLCPYTVCFCDKNEHLVIFQSFSEVGLAEVSPLASSHFSVQNPSKSALGLGSLWAS